ncbi:MAG: CreA family protein, partial [Thiotrichales bacterium]|nr:CreA family protein [Thiotrichales bacterium]
MTNHESSMPGGRRRICGAHRSPSPAFNSRSFFAVAVSLLLACGAARAETIGSVDTTFRMVGANDSIEIEAFDDPKIEGVTCHLSRAVT